MANRPTLITPEIYQYTLECGVREPEILGRLREETQSGVEMSVMQIGPEQGQFMALMAELLGAQAYLEIGVYTGYSCLAVALGMGPKGRVTALDISEDWAAVGKPYWDEAGLAGQIDLRIAPAVDSLQALLDEGRAASYDLAFIDADKESYDRYYEYCLELIRPGGVILMDNAFMMGGVAGEPQLDDVVLPDDFDMEAAMESVKVVDSLNRKIHADERVSATLLTVGDGLYMCRRC